MASNLPGNFAKVADLVQFHINQSILAFTALTAMAAVLVFGMVPALRATRTDLVSPLKERGNSQGGGGSRLNRGIVIAQVAMALGARPADVVWMVFRSSLLMVGIGVAIGAPLTLALGKVIASLLYGIGSRDPLLLGGAVLLLVLVALSSSALPARRASRVDPLVALRSE